MNYFHSLTIFLVLQICFWRTSLSLKSRSLFSKNGTLSHLRQRINHETNPDEMISTQEQTTSVVVLTSLSGIYVWWPILFGGDDSFHLLLSQEDVPRFHDVTGDQHGNIYLTAPHERTVYRLQYSDGWWISNFSNHSVMNSIRSEMPLFLTIHYISSIIYVYGHSDIQVIDLLQRPRARGSAPFMKRLRELSPHLRISDMIIDQLKSDGYIIGDSFGWCTVIRCALGVDECEFLFKLPSSYDDRPYACTGTIDFTNKIMYLSLEEKIVSIHLNEQTNYNRRSILAEKRGARSTLGYDDIVTYENVILYTDVLRPLLHICRLTKSELCLNISLIFPSPQRSILPLRLSIIQVSNIHPPSFDDDDEFELHINQTSPLSLIDSYRTTTTTFEHPIDNTSIKSRVHKETSIGNIWMLILGVCIGLVLAGTSFMIYYILSIKNRGKYKKDSTKEKIEEPLLPTNQSIDSQIRTPFTGDQFKPIPEDASETTESTTSSSSSSSYRPHTIV